MNRLDELIAELCPDGVEYHSISELFITRNGYTPSKSNPEYWIDGTVPWFRMEDIRENGPILSKAIQQVNRKAVKGDLFPADSIVVATSATIGQHALIKVKSLANQRFTYLMIKDIWKDKFDIKFLFYYCYKLDEFCLSHLNQGNFASVDMKQFVSFKFPVPPLEVQREIVRVLDNFTFLTAELSAELSARRKQYEYYRNQLLSFDSQIVRKPLGEVCTLVRGPFGGSLKKECFVNEGYAVYEQQHAIYGKYEFRYHITEQKYRELKRFSVAPGDLIMSCSGTMGKVSIVPENAPKGVINQALLKITAGPEINRYYLKYFFENTIEKRLNDEAKGGAIKNVAAVGELKQIEIPVPSMDIQNRLVDVLNNFESICLNLNIGLPAEIKARKQQYEYYRDLLLTFAESDGTLSTDRQAEIRLLQYVFGYVSLPLGETCNMKAGKAIKAVELADNEDIDHQYMCFGGNGLRGYIGKTNYSGGYPIIGRQGALCGNVQYAEGEFYATEHAVVVTSKGLYKQRYLYYLLTAMNLNQYKSAGAQPGLAVGKLEGICAPVPSLKKQEEVVRVLDRFDRLCNDLSSGLPAEIEARQKQYEYYRDKLLTFKELSQ